MIPATSYCSLSLCGKTAGCDPEKLGSSPRDCTNRSKNGLENYFEFHIEGVVKSLALHNLCNK